ncbi:unnamed protein product [Lampetra planeri]
MAVVTQHPTPLLGQQQQGSRHRPRQPRVEPSHSALGPPETSFIRPVYCWDLSLAEVVRWHNKATTSHGISSTPLGPVDLRHPCCHKALAGAAASLAPTVGPAENRHGIALHGTARYGTEWHSTARYGTEWHSTRGVRWCRDDDEVPSLPRIPSANISTSASTVPKISGTDQRKTAEGASHRGYHASAGATADGNDRRGVTGGKERERPRVGKTTAGKRDARDLEGACGVASPSITAQRARAQSRRASRRSGGEVARAGAETLLMGEAVTEDIHRWLYRTPLGSPLSSTRTDHDRSLSVTRHGEAFASSQWTELRSGGDVGRRERCSALTALPATWPLVVVTGNAWCLLVGPGTAWCILAVYQWRLVLPGSRGITVSGGRLLLRARDPPGTTRQGPHLWAMLQLSTTGSAGLLCASTAKLSQRASDELRSLKRTFPVTESHRIAVRRPSHSASLLCGPQRQTALGAACSRSTTQSRQRRREISREASPERAGHGRSGTA